MTRKEIMNGIQSLSTSQGFYSRLYVALREPENRNVFFRQYKPAKYRDIVEFVMDLEG
jgi:hypothetical protein